MRLGLKLARPLALLVLIAPVASAISLIAYWVYIYNWQGDEWHFAPLLVSTSVNATTLYTGQYVNISVDVSYPPPWEYLNQTAYYYYITGPYYSPERSYYYNGTYYPNETAYLNNQYYNFTVPKNITFTVMVNVYKLAGTASILYYHTSFNGTIELNVTGGNVSKAIVHAGSVVVRFDTPGTYVIKVFVWNGYPSVKQTQWASLSGAKVLVVRVLAG